MKRLMKALLYGLLAATALLVLPVVVLRWLPVPTSSYMLQSPTKPVHYQWVPEGKIAQVAKQAVVAAEDQKFPVHQGFDLEAMEKAYAHNQKSRRKRGASTITQQTAKNLFLWSGGGYFRKGIEALYTVLIEAIWPKQRILTVYLNIAEFGSGIYGVEAAAQAYFKKSASQLTANEAARLAAVLPSPRKWSVSRPGPYVQKRTAWILRQMGYGRNRHAPAEEEPEPPPEEEAADLPPPVYPAEPQAPDEAALPLTPEQQLQQELLREEERRAREILDAPGDMPAPSNPDDQSSSP